MHTYKHLAAFLLLLFPFIVAAKNPEAGQGAQFTPSNNLAFIENKGQVTDQDHKPRTDIDFKINVPGMDIFIGDGEIHYQWKKTFGKWNIKDDGIEPVHPGVEIYRLDVSLLGASINAPIVMEEKQSYYERYYLAHTGENGLMAGSYKKVTYKNIYPNIDWVLYITQNQLKYDFIVHPGGNTGDIQLKYAGATSLELVENELLAATPFGNIKEQKPYCYEQNTRQEVASEFVLSNDILKFKTDPVNGTLVIDPTLIWSTYLGGTGEDIEPSIETDIYHRVYLAGTTSSVNIATTGAYQQSFGGGMHDCLFAKFTTDGQHIWTTYYGGTGDDKAWAIYRSGNNSIYIVGQTNSTSGISTPASQYATYRGGLNDAFYARFDSSGQLLYGTYFGGPGDDRFYKITRADGEIHVVGSTTSTTGIASSSIVPQPTLAGGIDALIARFGSSNMSTWSTYFGGPGDDYGFDITESSGTFAIAGITSSTSGISFGGPNLHQSYFGGGANDAFVAAFTSLGLNWATYVGGPGNEFNPAANTVRQIDMLYGVSSLYLAGVTNSTSGIASTPSPLYTPYQASLAGGYDLYVMPLISHTGEGYNATYFGGPNDENSPHLATDVLLTGTTISTAGIATPSTYTQAYHGGQDIFIAEFDNLRKSIYSSSYFGGPGDDYPAELLFLPKGEMYLAGHTTSQTGISTTGAHQPINAGGSDFFLSRLFYDTTAAIRLPLLQTSFCPGQSGLLPYLVSTKFKSNNIFTAQLSDASGSFANPVTIGTLSESIPDTIHFTIPPGTAPGTGYRIRIISSSPARISADNGTDLTINLIPNVTVGSNGPVCGGNTLNLTAGSSIGGVSYSWTGPGSFTSNLQNPSRANINGSHAGWYVATANNNGCTAKDSVNVIVDNPNPTINSNSPVCEGATLNLSASSTTSGVNYSWTGPNGFTSNQQNPSISNISLAASGTYTVTITTASCASTLSVPVMVNAIPPAPTVGSNSPVCTGNTINITATGSTGSGYNWAGPTSFSSTQQNPSIANATTAMSGNYTVTATLNGCTSAPASLNVVVNTTPAAVVANSNSPVCSGDTLFFTGSTTTPGATYSWTGPGSYTSNLQNPFITNTTTAMSGSYSFSANLNGCSATALANVTIKTTPVKPTITHNTPVCGGRDLYLTGTSSTTGVSYQWTGSNNFTSNQQNPIINNIPASPVNPYYYELKTILNGCISEPDTEYVLVTTSPPYPIIANDSSVCPGDSLRLYVVFASAVGVNYHWRGANAFSYDGISYDTTIYNFTNSDTGIYKVWLTMPSSGCPSDTNYVRITATNPVTPTVSIAASPSLNISPWATITFTATPNNGGATPAYQWLLNGQAVPGATGNTWSSYALNNNDAVSVIMTSTEPCVLIPTDTSNTLMVHVNTGIDKGENLIDLQLYPNPNSGDFTLRAPVSAQEADIKIFNAIGQCIYTHSVHTVNGQLEHAIHLDAASGIYLLKLETGDMIQNIGFRLIRE